jgi:ribosome assembly protein YihI (activator of Der GTPase)
MTKRKSLRRQLEEATAEERRELGYSLMDLQAYIEAATYSLQSTESSLDRINSLLEEIDVEDEDREADEINDEAAKQAEARSE